MLPRMDTPLHIEPADFLPVWEKDPLHQEIQAFQLPKAEVIDCPMALLTASQFLSSEKGLGGIYDHKGQYLHCSRHLRRKKDFTRANPCHIDVAGKLPILSGRYLYLGWFFNHYGHFMMESLSRCWPLLEKQQFDGYLYHFHARSPRPSAQLFEFLDLLDIPRDKLHFITRDMQVENLYIPTQQAVLSRTISPKMLHLYQHLGKTAWERQGRPGGQSKIYISRRLLPPDMRHARNEYLLEQHFRRLGYRVFHPQLHSPQEQLALFYQSTHLAGLEGSGLHHVLFARAPQETWLLATPQRRIDAITQAQLDRYRSSKTRILFQKGCPSPLLRPEHTSFLVTSNSLAYLGMKTEPDPWSRAVWLQGLARQLTPIPDALDDFAQQVRLSAMEKKFLSFLLHPKETLDDPAFESPLGKAVSALAFHAQGDLAAAKIALAESLEHCRNNPDFLGGYASLLRQLKEPGKGEEILGMALALDPDNPELLLLQAQLLEDTGRANEAKSRLEEILSHTPLFRPALIALASILADQSDFTTAAACLTKAIDIFPGNGRLHVRLTWFLMQAGEWPRAAAAAEAALQRFPQNPHSHTHLAHIRLALDEPERALEHINEAILRQPQNPAHYRLRARLYRELGNTEAALADENRVKESRNPPES